MPELQLLRKEIQQLTSTITQLNVPKHSSWAQVAAAPQEAPLAKPPPPRRAREMTITCPNGIQESTPKTAADIVKNIRSQPGGSGEILGARRLPSGAVTLTFRNTEAKQLWKEQGKVEAVFGPASRVKESTTDIIVFGFPRGDMSRLAAEDRRNAIIRHNPNLASSLLRVGVLKGSQAKSYEAVILGLEDPLAANSVIESGILWEASVLNAEPFTKEIRSSRCFKCQSYTNHTTRLCRSPGRCGWCAQTGHTVSECPVSHNINEKACAPCGGQRGHCALDAHCPMRRRDDERARAAYLARPSKFEAPTLARTDQCRNEAYSQRHRTESEDDSFVIVNNKRRRGRPTDISKVDTTGMPNIASLLQVSSTPFSSPPSQSSIAAPPSSQIGIGNTSDTNMPDPTS
jgi:hypothetical protein